MVVQNYSKFVFVLIFIICFCWIAISQIPDSNLHLITCDVGQGDAILVVYKNYQILTDGGPPNGKVDRCLSRHLPFWDRTIEVVVNTHPQLDHFGGLIEVFKKYKVINYISSDIEPSTQEYGLLHKLVKSGGTGVLTPYDVRSVGVGLITYDIFYPSQAVADEFKSDPKRDSNDVSIQSIVRMGEFKALLTGDIGENMTDQVLKNFTKLSINYIKIPHHGSRYGLVESYLREFMPALAVISVGKDNSYGHPAPEVIKILSDKDIKILRTDTMGDVEIVTNGKEFWVEN
jgi:competence protein ComEC